MFFKNLSLENLTTVYNGKTYIEEWKPIRGYESTHQISSFGRVRSTKNNIIMRQQVVKGKGYLSVHIGRVKHRIHRLVAINFIKNPNNKPEVNHEDFDKTNNFFKNLTWMTAQENTRHAQVGGKRSIKVCAPKPMGRLVYRKMIVNAETGVVYDSVEVVGNIMGLSVKEMQKRLNGDRRNNTPFRYLEGQYFKFRREEMEMYTNRYFELRNKLLGY